MNKHARQPNNAPSDYRVLRGDTDAEAHERAQSLVAEAFAPFMDHSPIINKYWRYLYSRWAQWQFLFADRDNNAVVMGNCFPLQLDLTAVTLPDGGVEWALKEAVRQSDDGIAPNAACAFQIVISHAVKGQGLSYRAIDCMKSICRDNGVSMLIAPVRPNRKERDPMMPIDEYVAMRRDDDLPVDDWMRVHVRLGGEMLNICSRSFIVDGSLDEWEEWTGQRFHGDGLHAVEGGLVPVEVNDGRGRYVEPNVWFRHPLT